MTVTIRKDVLSKAIGIASKAVGANPVIPLLSNLLFENNNGSSRVAATNLEIGISYTFPSSGEELRVCMPASIISGLVEAIHSDEIDIVLDAHNQSIMVMTDNSTSNVRCASPDEFPDIPKVTKASFRVPVMQFKEMVQRVAFCAANSAGMTVLEGVQLSVEDGKLILFAVDGYHLSYEETPVIGKAKPIKPFIVKASTLEIVSRILPDEGDLEVQAEENKAMFQCGNVDIVTQLMNGEYPDYHQLQKASPPATTMLTISTLEMLRAARQLRVFAVDTGVSKLDIKGMLIRYSTVTKDRGDSDITFAAVKKGDDILVGINVHLLCELLEICKTEYITVEMAGEKSPLLFKMYGVDSFYHVIMPIAF
jgi:DNA polymerase-3 subunit beta